MKNELSRRRHKAQSQEASPSVPVSEIQDSKGRFAKGNPGGKLKSPITAKGRAIAEVCRELWEEHGVKTAREILESRRNYAVKVRLIELLLERGYGKVPQKLKLGIDDESPEGILLRLAGQTVPGGDESN